MDALEVLQQRKWEHPSDYGGFSPDGDYVIVGRCRDSGIAEESNYHSAMKQLQELAEKFDPPDLDNSDDRNTSYDGWTERAHAWVYDFRASHWGVGWVETLLVRDDAPEEILQAAAEIVCALEEYPVLDDEDFSERENDLIQETWDGMSTKERLNMFGYVKAECSMFAVRRDVPPNDWRVTDYLRGEG